MFLAERVTEVGMQLEVNDSAGKTIPVRVEASDASVKLDANHPLAGKTWFLTSIWSKSSTTRTRRSSTPEFTKAEDPGISLLASWRWKGFNGVRW